MTFESMVDDHFKDCQLLPELEFVLFIRGSRLDLMDH